MITKEQYIQAREQLRAAEKDLVKIRTAFNQLERDYDNNDLPEAKRCPWCWSKVNLDDDPDEGFSIGCSNTHCNITVHIFHAQSRRDAIEIWNTYSAPAVRKLCRKKK